MSLLRIVRTSASGFWAIAMASLGAVLLFSASASAASGTWKGANTDALWATATNWNGGVPNALSDSATFTGASGAGGAVLTSGTISLNTLLFSSTAAAYTIGGAAAGTGQVTLADSGNITVNSTVANNETINANLILGTATSSSYTLNNGSTTNPLMFGGSIKGGSGGTAGNKTLTIAGAGNTTIGGNITAGGSSGIVVTDTSGGTLALTGVSTILTLNVNGGAGSVVNLTGGNITFNNAGLGTFQSSAGGTVSGGTVTVTTGVAGDYGDFGAASGGTLTINSTIAGSAGIGIDFYNGSAGGTTVLTGSNTFSGPADIFQQTVVVSSIGNGGSVGNLGTNATIQMGLNGVTGTLKYTGTGETNNRVINLHGTTGGAALDQSGTGLLKFTGSLTAATAGAKTLTLQGSTAGSGELAGAIVDSGGGATSVSK